ncbi:hypothetical protein JRO89_XS13G0042200 [Xanthoceras sorbifolium]|uniref:MINDY deubiquitinase domain-containing protein n=1 Tax=Xanthoceras sorbifolium TaxID=99658 RepID=A0ABQ8H6F9_9ROSI|nr:hypothetical protein JRO89_XS13G0042200 [Xanthoceras sorbifolium]
MADSSEDQQQTVMKECMHKTKTIQFLGRTTPIILQNDNGPCPLLAICNLSFLLRSLGFVVVLLPSKLKELVLLIQGTNELLTSDIAIGNILLLRNNLNLSPDIGEVSQEKLLSLVAERLIDSNINVNNKDAEYVENQQQNIADAIDLLPRLATGIDVNIKFRRIDDFEFTPECAIFDLLDIPLYHGWIVDAQDFDTAKAIGFKSYNTLMGELVALESIRGECRSNSEEDCVDFAAATTATLGVPSPCLSKTRSFDDSPHSVSDQQNTRKGDFEEAEELMRALKLSETELPTSLGDSPVENVNGATMSVNLETCSSNEVALDSVHTLEKHIGVRDQSFHQPEPFISDNGSALSNDNKNNQSGDIKLDQLSKKESGEHIVEKTSVETLVVENAVSPFPGKATLSAVETRVDICQGGEVVENQSTQSTSVADVHEPADNRCGCSTTELSDLSVLNADADSSSGRIQDSDVPETYPSSVDGSEPIYEGEECILDTGTAVYEDREPVYEGEVILAEQADKTTSDACNVRSNDEFTPQQGELIRNFFRNNASQLTFYGLFCLQDGLKERELCVFFRNNHFSTMFKFDGELYLLATDQGYINQPDLVWEKLNEVKLLKGFNQHIMCFVALVIEFVFLVATQIMNWDLMIGNYTDVNGDTLFMTSNFKEFKLESHTNDTWDEHGVMTSTADYLASIDSAGQSGLDINCDECVDIGLPGSGVGWMKVTIAYELGLKSTVDLSVVNFMDYQERRGWGPQQKRGCRYLRFWEYDNATAVKVTGDPTPTATTDDDAALLGSFVSLSPSISLTCFLFHVSPFH